MLNYQRVFEITVARLLRAPCCLVLRWLATLMLAMPSLDFQHHDPHADPQRSAPQLQGIFGAPSCAHDIIKTERAENRGQLNLSTPCLDHP